MNNIKDCENLSSKRVLLRLDLNVPLKNGDIVDETRIIKIIPVIEFLIIIKNSITGIILIILVSSTMSPFFKGTFRSNLNKTLLLLRFSQSLILFIKNSYEDILQYHTFYLRNPIRYHTRLKFYPYFYSPLLLSFRLLLKKQDYD